MPGGPESGTRPRGSSHGRPSSGCRESMLGSRPAASTTGNGHPGGGVVQGGAMGASCALLSSSTTPSSLLPSSIHHQYEYQQQQQNHQQQKQHHHQHDHHHSHHSGARSKAPSLLLLPVCTTLWVLLGMAGGVGSQENTSHPYGEIGYGYWAQGVTSYPCTSPEDCALMFNASDPLRDAILLEEDGEETESEPCVITGHLARSVNWFGYLAEFQLRASGGRIYYRFVYPEDRCCIKIIFYLEEQVLGLRARMNCLQKQAMVDPGSRQVILLSPTDASAGCVSNKTDNGVRVIECTSGRVLKSNEDRTWSIAASSCGSPTGLDIRYSFVAYGHKGECPEPTQITSGASSPTSRAILTFPVMLLTATAAFGALLYYRPSARDAVR